MLDYWGDSSTSTSKFKSQVGGTIMNLKTLKIYELLERSHSSYHGSIRKLWSDKTIDCIVLFEHPQQQSKMIVSVGPNSEYKTLEHISSVTIDGMYPYGYVQCRHASRGKSSGLSELFWGVLKNRKKELNPADSIADAALEPIDNYLDEVEDKESDEAVIKLREEIKKLKQENAELKRYSLKVTTKELELEERESFLVESENKLLFHTQQHLEKEAEQEQREERLNEREKEIAEQVKRLNPDGTLPQAVPS